MTLSRPVVFSVAAVLLAGSPLAAQDTCPCPPTPGPGWDGSVGGGLALSSGNSDTRSINLNGSTVYDPKTKHVFKASGLYLRSDDDGEVTVDRTALNARDERALTNGLFLFGEIGFQRDRLKELDRLLSPVVGAGYRLVNRPSLTVDLDGGLGLAIEKLTGQDGTTDGALRSGQSLTWKLSPTATVTEKATALWKLGDFGDAYYHVEAALTTAIARRLELKLAYITDVKNRPADPTLRKRDTSLVVAVVYRFRPS